MIWSTEIGAYDPIVTPYPGESFRRNEVLCVNAVGRVVDLSSI